MAAQSADGDENAAIGPPPPDRTDPLSPSNARHARRAWRHLRSRGLWRVGLAADLSRGRRLGVSDGWAGAHLDAASADGEPDRATGHPDDTAGTKPDRAADI